MKIQYEWNVDDIFKNEEEFYCAIKKIRENLEKIEQYKNILCKTEENLYNCYKLCEETLEIFEKVYRIWNVKISQRYV